MGKIGCHLKDTSTTEANVTQQSKARQIMYHLAALEKIGTPIYLHPM